MTEGVLITGATGVIGSEISRSLLQEGYNVIAVSRSADTVREKINSGASNLYPLQADLSLEDSPAAIVEALERQELSVTAVVHAARDLRTLKKRSDLRVDDWFLEYRLAVVFPYLLAYEFLRSHPVSSIVLVSSMYGVVAQNPALYGGDTESFAPHYAASKAAMIHLAKQLAVELAPKTRVNSVSYGGVRGRADQFFEDRYSKLAPSNNMIEPDQVAGPVVFLVDGEKSSGITGANIIADGGWSVW